MSTNSVQQQGSSEFLGKEDDNSQFIRKVDICAYLTDHYIHRYRRYENYLDCSGQLNYREIRCLKKHLTDNNTNKDYSKMNKKNQSQINMFVQSLRHDQPYQVRPIRNSHSQLDFPNKSTINRQQNTPLTSLATGNLLIQPLNDSLAEDSDPNNQLSTYSSNNLQGQNTQRNTLDELSSSQQNQLNGELKLLQHLLNSQSFHRCCRIILCLIKWRRLCRYLRQTRQKSVEQFQTLDLLSLAVNSALDYSTLAMKPVLFEYFQESSSLDYFSYRNQAKYFTSKLSKLKAYTIQLLDSIAQYTVSALTSNNDMIAFLNSQIGQYQFLFDGLYPRFLHERFEFSNDTLEIRNITVSQRQLLSIFFYVIYGILNRLIDPWRALNIKDIDKAKRINAHVMLSIIFYLLHDYMKKHAQLVKTSSRYPAERMNPLRAYTRQQQFQEQDIRELGFVDTHGQKNNLIDSIEQLDQQAVITDNIMVGLTLRMLLVDIIEKDADILSKAEDTFRSISQVFVKQIDLAPPIL